jgi:hypothetical protein
MVKKSTCFPMASIRNSAQSVWSATALLLTPKRYLKTFKHSITTVLITIRKQFSLIGKCTKVAVDSLKNPYKLSLIWSNFRCHMVTAMHRNVRDRIRDLRKDKIWLSCEDVAQAWKPLKMGLRLVQLRDDWKLFVESYDRVMKTSDALFQG